MRKARSHNSKHTLESCQHRAREVGAISFDPATAFYISQDPEESSEDLARKCSRYEVSSFREAFLKPRFEVLSTRSRPINIWMIPSFVLIVDKKDRIDSDYVEKKVSCLIKDPGPGYFEVITGQENQK